MGSDHSEKWVVGFLYRLSTIAGVLLLVLYMLWWVMSVTVGIITASSLGWGFIQWIVATLVVIGSLRGFDELMDEIRRAWRDSDLVDRLIGPLTVAGIAYWIISYLDWRNCGHELEDFLSKWSIEWDTVKGIMIGAVFAIALRTSGRLLFVGVLHVCKSMFWLITGERWDRTRAGF